MGITDVFDPETADLLGMFPHFLYISRLIQRAEIDVNEEGTVASAASGWYHNTQN
jgi:serine protease inhibitor